MTEPIPAKSYKHLTPFQKGFFLTLMRHIAFFGLKVPEYVKLSGTMLPEDDNTLENYKGNQIYQVHIAAR